MRKTMKKAPYRRTVPARRAAQILMEGNTSALTKEETDQISEATQLKISQLSKKLVKKASPLKKEIKDHLEKMTSIELDGKDGFSKVGIIFDGKDGSEKIKLESGEADTKKGTEKIEKITSACVAVVKEDLSFLKKALKNIGTSKLSEEDRHRLIEIFEKNSYFRFLEII